MNKIKVFIVDDHPVYTKGLVMQLREMPGIDVAGIFQNPYDFLDKIEEQLPDIVLMDVKMPGLNGIETTKAALQKKPELKILALTMFDDDYTLNSMLSAGAKGLLSKNLKKGELAKAIGLVTEGGIYLPERLSII